MTQATDVPAFYESELRNLPTSLALETLRTKARKEFLRLGFPVVRRGNELWKYTNVRSIARRHFSLASPAVVEEVPNKAPWDNSWHNLVFVNGRFSPKLSLIQPSKGLVVSSLKEALSRYPEKVLQHLGALAPYKEDAFVSLSTAYMQDGAYIEIGEGTEAEHPIHLLFIMSEDKPYHATYPRSLILCRENSSASIIESYVNLSEGSQLLSGVSEIDISHGASLRHYRIQIENGSSYHICSQRVAQREGSKFETISLALGAAIGRYDLHVHLNEPRAECSIEGLYLTTDRQHQSNEINTTHWKPHCTSRQFLKGVLSGKSQAVFSGKIKVAPDAQKTEAEQKDLNLVLSRGAEIDTKPSLEIYADDVKCAHGATAGHVDENAIFYLQSRGLDLRSARAMLVRGFVSEILDKFEEPSLLDYAERAAETLMPSMLDAADLDMPKTI